MDDVYMTKEEARARFPRKREWSSDSEEEITEEELTRLRRQVRREILETRGPEVFEVYEGETVPEEELKERPRLEESEVWRQEREERRAAMVRDTMIQFDGRGDRRLLAESEALRYEREEPAGRRLKRRIQVSHERLERTPELEESEV
jgi:hypothetical protein